MARKRKHTLPDPNQLLLFTAEEMSGEGKEVEATDVDEETNGMVENNSPRHEISGKGLALMTNVIRLLDGFPTSQVRLIAMQSAALVQSGVDALESYCLPALPGMVLGGDVLEYVAYVSIVRSFPHMVEKLGIDLSAEYQEASK